MKIKSLCLMFVQLVMFSSLGYSQEKCQDGDFWQTWFEESHLLALEICRRQIKLEMLN